MPKRKRIRPVGIVVVPRTKKDQERRDALNPREALKRKAKDQERRDALSPREAFKRKAAEELTGRLGGARLGKQKTKEKAQKGKEQAEIEGPVSRFSKKEQEMLRDLLRKQKKPKEPKTKYPIRRVPKTRKKPPTSRRI